MAEDQSKHIEELVGRLKKMGRNVPIDTVAPVVEALKVHGELVALLAESNERLAQSNEQLLDSFTKAERWTKAIVFLTFILVALTFYLLVVADLRALGPDVRQTLPNWAVKAWAVFLAVALVAFALVMVFVVIYFAKAQKALVPPKRKG